MSKGEKKSSSYSLLKTLDESVQKDKKKVHRDSKSAFGNRKKRDDSPKRSYSRRKDDYKRYEPVQIEEEELDYDIPDRSFGDLYCKACDSHMNSEQMWDAHIRGKRHLKQIKKGEPDLKYEDLDEDPIILPELRNVKEPIVGLQHCCEVQRLQGKPTYQCFLCSAAIATSNLLIEHVIGLKHRMAYLKEYDSDNYNVIMKADLKKGMIEPVVEEYIQKLEDKRGSGKMPVKIEKPKPKEIWLPANHDKKASTFSNRKRPYQDDLFQNTKNSGRRDTYDNVRNESKFGDSSCRSLSDRTKDYPRNFSPSPVSDSSRGNSWIHERYEKPETSYVRRSSLTPPHISEKQFVRSHTDLKTIDTNLPWSKPDPPSHCYEPIAKPDVQRVLEKKWMNDLNQRQNENSSNPSDLFIYRLKEILKDLPQRVFLELVLHVLKRMDPTDAAVDILHEIGNYAVNLVLKKRMEKSSELFNISQEKSASTQGSFFKSMQQESSKVNISAIQDLIDLYKNKKSETSSMFASQNTPTQPAYGTSTNYDAAYSTQPSTERLSIWGNPSNSKDSTAIPGLSLSATQESSSDNRLSYPQNQSDDRYSTLRSIWSQNQYNDPFNRY